MADKKYFINNGDANLGPWDMVTIVDKVNKLEVKATDQLCVNVDNDEWILVCQHPDFVKLAQKSKPGKKSEPVLVNPFVANPIAEAHNVTVSVDQKPAVGKAGDVAVVSTIDSTLPVDLEKAQWFVLKGKNRFGPFAYFDLIRMLQEKSVFEFDFAWTNGMEKWRRIAEIEYFSHDNIRTHIGGDQAEASQAFFRRSFERARYEAQLICHDNTRIWKGHTVEISEGGAGVLIENSLIVPGQNVYLHFKPGAYSKSFNVLCEVVSKRFMKSIKDSEAPVVYGVKFININKQDRESIRLIHKAA